MNAISGFILLLSLITNTWTFAQSTSPLTDYKGHILLANGRIVEQGKSIGLITKEGIIQDAKGKKLALLNSDGTLSDASGKSLGRRSKDGQTYYDASGNLVFTVKDNPDAACDILDAKGKNIGMVYDSVRGNACALHWPTGWMVKRTESRCNADYCVIGFLLNNQRTHR